MFAWMHHPNIAPSLEAHRQKHHRSTYHVSHGAFDGIPNWCSLYYDACINSHDIIFFDGNCIFILHIQHLLQWISLHPNMIGWLTTLKLVICQVCSYVFALNYAHWLLLIFWKYYLNLWRGEPSQYCSFTWSTYPKASSLYLLV